MNKMMRLAAEFDNYKKRNAKEHENIRKYAAENLIKELLPIVDNFERAIESASESNLVPPSNGRTNLVSPSNGRTNDFNSFFDGVKLILSQMINLLEKEGVIAIKSIGEAFNPNFHEAVMHINSDKYPENVVAEEYQKGYILKDRFIRPSKVAVSKGKIT
ncbi:MAG: nucleotide exchange factor GrpE [Candidatus Poribacteria bacterium]